MCLGSQKGRRVISSPFLAPAALTVQRRHNHGGHPMLVHIEADVRRGSRLYNKRGEVQVLEDDWLHDTRGERQ
jgi:hypothetical protein